MLGLLLTACLNLNGFALEPPPKAEPPAKEEPLKEEEPAPKAKPHRKPPSPAVPDEDTETPRPKPKRPARAAAPAAPAASRFDPSALEHRVAHLEEENARLRLQLALGGTAPWVNGDPASALAELAAGNLRFATGTRMRTLLSSDDAALRTRLAKEGAPLAVLVTCSDSRLSEALLFDQELGRLYAIREAGNALDNLSLGSVEFALDHLGARLVVVLGHLDCEVVKLVVEAHGKPLPGNQWALQAAMTGLLENVPEDPNEEPEARLRRLVEGNAQRQAQALLDRSAVVGELVRLKKVQVVPAVYDPASGRVNFLAAVVPSKR